MRVVAGGPASVVLRNAKSPPMCTKSAKSAWKLIALKETTPALTLNGAVTPSMSSVPRLTALTASELYFTVTLSAVTVAKPGHDGHRAQRRLQRLVAVFLDQQRQVAAEADAVKTLPSDRLTETLDATTSIARGRGPAKVVLRKAKSPPMCTKSGEVSLEVDRLEGDNPGIDAQRRVTPSMSSVPRLTALTASELYFTVTLSADRWRSPRRDGHRAQARLQRLVAVFLDHQRQVARSCEAAP